MKRKLELQDVLDVPVLQEIQDYFSEATGLAAVTIDSQGRPVTQISRCSPFCARMRSHPEWRKACELSDFVAAQKALEIKRPYIYICHAGLLDTAAPIVVDNAFLGCLLAGQVFPTQEDLEQHEPPTLSLKTDWHHDTQAAYEFAQIQQYPMKRLHAAVQCLSIMANYIAERGVALLTQRELHKQNIKLMQKERARAQLEKALKETELKALQSQINPHFLFNTLNTISRLMALEGEKRAQEVIQCLAGMLRYNLRHVQETATLSEEIENIRRYLFIQKVRFGKRLQVDINVEPKVENVKIPLLSLQPLVENCIVHGIEPKKEGGKVTLKAWENNSRVFIEVCDNGVGIAEQKLCEIQNAENPSGRCHGHTTGLGISNVNLRLKHYFGPSYSLDIDSKPGQGTRILLSFRPAKE